MQESLFNEVTGLQVCNFTEKRLQHRPFRLNIANFKNTCFEKHLQTLLIVVIYCIENWTKLFRNQTGLLFLLKHKIILFYLLPFVLIRFITRCHSLPFFVTRCHWLSLVVTHCHLLSLAVPLVVTRFHSWYHSLSFGVLRCTIRCHSLYNSLSFVVTRCHSLSLDVPLVCLFINNRKRNVLKDFVNFTRKHLR